MHQILVLWRHSLALRSSVQCVWTISNGVKSYANLHKIHTINKSRIVLMISTWANNLSRLQFWQNNCGVVTILSSIKNRLEEFLYVDASSWMFNWSKSISDPYGYICFPLDCCNILNENFHQILSDLFLPSAVKFIFRPCLHVTFFSSVSVITTVIV